MLTPQTLQELLVLNRLSLTGAKAVHGLLLNGLAPAEILRQIREENFLNKKAALDELSVTFDAAREIELAEKHGARILTFLDEDYPARLRTIADPPLVLYTLGSILEVDRAAIAIVGTRHPSFYGTAQARKFSRELSEKGFTVVSGLAQGIDQVAHEASLGISYGRTIGVLGCGLDIDYPSGSKKLREAIASHGAVITEYAFGTSPRAENFPRRNRIIAGLALGVLVIEAHSKSGSLITAHLAADEGREVFAVPGSVEQLGSRGTHHLIKEGAHLVENAADVLSVLGPITSFQLEAVSPQSVTAEFPEFEKIEIPQEADVQEEEESELLQALREKPLSSDEIGERAAGSAAQLNSALTLLELQGKVRRQHDGRYALAGAR